jgi:transposase
VTNYHFEIDDEDEMLRKGVAKNHRPDPIVQMGLLLDNNGVPMTYELFPGNLNDCKTFVQIMAKVRRNFNVGKMVVIADKGMNTASNAYYIANGRGWYIFSQTVRGGTKELKKYVLDKSGYVSVGSEYMVKSRQFTRSVEIEQGDGVPPILVDISEKQVVFYSEKYAKKARRDREKTIQKARDIIRNPSGFKKYNTYGAAKYVGNLEYDKDTGEIIKTKSKIFFDEKKLREDEAYDGYYLIVTNCFNKPDDWIVDKYRGLWQIEETFKVSKSDLEARPVYVKLWEHIKAHFLICFIALTITKLLQNRISEKHYVTKVIENLSRACCAHIDTNRYMSYYYDDVLSTVGNALGIDFSNKYMTLSDIRKLIGDTKK